MSRVHPRGPGTDRGRTVLQFVAAGVAIALGAYSGLHLFLPLAATGLAWWAGTRVLPESRRPVLPAAAVQAGHLLWLAFGQVVGRGLDRGVIDLVILAIGVAWLVARPGLAPILLLTLYQAWALVTNGTVFIGAEPGSMAHRALLIHLVWRLLALALMWRAYAALRREHAAGRIPPRPS